VANRDIEAARFFHEVTKHSYTSVRSTPHRLDWENRPLPYKIYPDAPVVMLPRDLNLATMPTLEALSSTVAGGSATPLDLATLTRMLFCAGGLTRHRRVGGEDYHFRAAPSAGALYPVELYVAAGEVEGLAPGLYHFSPADLKLRALRPGDFRLNIARAANDRDSLAGARANLIASTIFWRSTWKYHARAYRYCFWDTGTMLANLLAVANAEGHRTEVVTAFLDAELEVLIGADGEREGIACVVALGTTAAARESSDAASAIAWESLPLSPGEVSYPDLVRVHQASRLESLDEVAAIATASPPDPGPPVSAGGLGLGETVLRRGATRAFSHDSIPADDLNQILAASSGPVPADFRSQCEIYLIVNAVDGIEAGAYRYDRASGALELIKRGEFRGNAGYLCLEQAVGLDCSVLVCYMAALERALATLGNRGYRDLHLEAGLLGGRACLGAFALGHGATGLTFYDDDTASFFGPGCDNKSPILMVALGMPAPARAIS